MSSIPTNEALYNKIKEEISKKHKPSAYRSGLIVKEYKQEMLKLGKPSYHGKKNENEGLSRWFREVWRSDNGSVGYQHRN